MVAVPEWETRNFRLLFEGPSTIMGATCTRERFFWGRKDPASRNSRESVMMGLQPPSRDPVTIFRTHSAVSQMWFMSKGCSVFKEKYKQSFHVQGPYFIFIGGKKEGIFRHKCLRKRKRIKSLPSVHWKINYTVDFRILLSFFVFVQVNVWTTSRSTNNLTLQSPI